jgi:hypothetical protein
MLRWRLFGINFRIEASFWIMNALWAFILYQPIMGPREHGQLLSKDLLIMMLIWVLCMLVTVMVHELGHVITGRVFGQPGNVTLTGLGGQAVGEYGELAPWQRIIVIFMGPCAGFLFVAALTAADGRPWNWCMEWFERSFEMPFFGKLKCELFLIHWVNPKLANPALQLLDPRSQFPIYNIVVLLLFVINLFTNIMNLLPIIPMDGGMIFKEVCCLLAPRGGLKFAFAWSFLLALGCTVYLLVVVLVQYRFLSPNYALWYPFAFPEFSLLIFGMLAYRSWVTYQQLSRSERYMDYMQDDMSGPRREQGVVEVPVKDPDEFAPRAPGSERPR